MKKYIFAVLLLIPNISFADSKISAMTETTSPSKDDNVPVVINVSTSPANRRSSIANIFKSGDITIDGTNVGMGSTAPGKKLDVQGTIRATAFLGDGSGLSGVGGSPGGSGTELQFRGGTSTFSAVTGSGVVGGNVGIGSVNPTTNLDVNGTIKSTTSINGNQIIGSGYSSATAPTNGLLVQGNVGIGTTILTGLSTGTSVIIQNSLARQLILNDTSTPSASSGAGLTAQTNIIPTAANQRLGFLTFGARDVDSGPVINSENRNSVAIAAFSSQPWVSAVGVGTANGSYITISTTQNDAYSRTEALRITENQNVGIASTSPGQKLDVQGTVRATYLVGDGSGITNVGGSLWATQNTTDQSLAGGNVGIGTTVTNLSALTVMNGSVGIGTIKPTNLLTVRGNIGIGTASANSSALDIGNGAFVVSSNGNPTSNGNVGFVGPAFLTIGSSSTFNNTTLTLGSNGAIIKDASATAGSSLLVRGGSSTTSHLDLYDSAVTSTTGSYISLNVGNVGIGTVEGMRVLNGGNVGIGSASPGQTLDVQGTIRMSTGTAGQAACYKADKSLGQCTTVVGAGGGCTCS